MERAECQSSRQSIYFLISIFLFTLSVKFCLIFYLLNYKSTQAQYKEYEAKWETWREQLLQKREQLRKKRENKEAEIAAAAAAAKVNALR